MSLQTLDFGTVQLPCKVIKGRPNQIRIMFRKGELIVATATGNLQPFDQSFLAQKQNWILKHYSTASLANQERAKYLAALTEQASYLGKKFNLVFVQGLKDDVILEPDLFRITICIGKSLAKIPTQYQIMEALRFLAERYLSQRLAYWAGMMGLKYNRLTLKNHKTKWGSCSSKKNINLNWHLILLEPDLIDYVLIHELAHLVELNHSSRFWAIVARYYPTYQLATQRIKQKQWYIGIYE